MQKFKKITFIENTYDKNIFLADTCVIFIVFIFSALDNNLFDLKRHLEIVLYVLSIYFVSIYQKNRSLTQYLPLLGALWKLVAATAVFSVISLILFHTRFENILIALFFMITFRVFYYRHSKIPRKYVSRILYAAPSLSNQAELSPYMFKKTLDFTGAVLGILVFILPCILAALTIYFLEGRNPIFVQHRVGRNGKIFNMFKLSTINPDGSQMSRFAKFLRRTGFDELPQLINVLYGQMSLVGPRPELPELAMKENELELLRRKILPGITGYWQISPYRHLRIHEHFEYDLMYLKTSSLIVDIIVISLTPIYLFSEKH
jgi:lipopolysaccharide/colanic/teichoic acid biosynthesis glycosyltransferase